SSAESVPLARTMIVAEPTSSERQPTAAPSPANAPTPASPARNDNAATTNSSAQSRPSPLGSSGVGDQRLASKARLMGAFSRRQFWIERRALRKPSCVEVEHRHAGTQHQVGVVAGDQHGGADPVQLVE